MAALNPEMATARAKAAAISPDSMSLNLNPEIAAQLRRLTVCQYNKMTTAGVIDEDDPVELIEGLIVSKRGRNRPHIVAGNKGLSALLRIIPTGWHVAKEDPVTTSDWSKPEPDLAIVRGGAEDYLDRDVTALDVALVIEIAESSLSADQNVLARVYAASGIPVYWIVNLVDRQLEVYTNPGAEGYQTSQVYGGRDEVPVVIDGTEIGRIAASDVLPA